MEYIPKVLQAVAGEDFTIYLYFSDGSVRLYDAKPLLQLGGVFAPMRDPGYFRDRWKRHPEIKHNGTALVHHRNCAVP